MKTKTMTGKKGNKITILIPETEEDLKTLKQMEMEGKLDKTDYMHGETKPSLKK